MKMKATVFATDRTFPHSFCGGLHLLVWIVCLFISSSYIIMCNADDVYVWQFCWNAFQKNDLVLQGHMKMGMWGMQKWKLFAICCHKLYVCIKIFKRTALLSVKFLHINSNSQQRIIFWLNENSYELTLYSHDLLNVPKTVVFWNLTICWWLIHRTVILDTRPRTILDFHILLCYMLWFFKRHSMQSRVCWMNDC